MPIPHHWADEVTAPEPLNPPEALLTLLVNNGQWEPRLEVLRDHWRCACELELIDLDSTIHLKTSSFLR